MQRKKPKKNKKTTRKRRRRKESAVQKKAFEYYLAMGPARSVKKVAEKFGYSPKTVYGWSSEFKWRERAYKYEQRQTERLRGLRENLSKESEEFLIESNVNLLRLIELSVEKYLEEVEEDEDRIIRLESTSDLKTIIGLTRLLLGEPTEIRREESYVVERTRELLERLKRSTGGPRESTS